MKYQCIVYNENKSEGVFANLVNNDEATRHRFREAAKSARSE